MVCTLPYMGRNEGNRFKTNRSGSTDHHTGNVMEH